MRRLDLTIKKTMTMTMTNTKVKKMTKIFREHPQRVILKTCDPWDIISKWQGDMTWPTKRQRQRQWQWQWQIQTQWQIHLESTLKECPRECDLWDFWSEWWGDITWPTKRQWQSLKSRRKTRVGDCIPWMRRRNQNWAPMQQMNKYCGVRWKYIWMNFMG